MLGKVPPQGLFENKANHWLDFAINTSRDNIYPPQIKKKEKKKRSIFPIDFLITILPVIVNRKAGLKRTKDAVLDI